MRCIIMIIKILNKSKSVCPLIGFYFRLHYIGHLAKTNLRQNVFRAIQYSNAIHIHWQWNRRAMTSLMSIAEYHFEITHKKKINCISLVFGKPIAYRRSCGSIICKLPNSQYEFGAMLFSVAFWTLPKVVVERFATVSRQIE